MSDLQSKLMGIAIGLVISVGLLVLIFMTNKSDIADTTQKCYDKGHIVSVDVNGQKYCDSGRRIYHIR